MVIVSLQPLYINIYIFERYKNLEVLWWARSQDPPCPRNACVCSLSVMDDDLDVLQWVRAQDPLCSWDVTTSRNGSLSGKVSLFLWLRPQDIPCPEVALPRICLLLMQ